MDDNEIDADNPHRTESNGAENGRQRKCQERGDQRNRANRREGERAILLCYTNHHDTTLPRCQGRSICGGDDDRDFAIAPEGQRDGGCREFDDREHVA